MNYKYITNLAKKKFERLFKMSSKALFTKIINLLSKENITPNNEVTEIVTMKDLLEVLAINLKKFDLLNKYSYFKNNKTLLYKDDVGSFRIELNAYRSFDLDRKEVSAEITPYYYRKFNTLHDWFKKHSVLSKSDFNSRASVFLEGANLGYQNNFHFLATNKNFEKDFVFFKDQIIKTEEIFFNRFQTLQQLYKYEALPIVNNKDFKFELHADEDLFVLLRLVYLVSPENFEEMNNRVYNHFLFMRDEYKHPDALIYLVKYDEIIGDLKKG